MWRVILVLGAVLAGCAQRSPLRATLHWEDERTFIGVAEPDSENPPGLVLIESDFCIQPVNLRLEASDRTWHFEHGTFTTRSLTGAMDAKHIWATFKRHDSLFLVDVNGRREMFVTSGRDVSPPEGWDGEIGEVTLRDIDADKVTEAVVIVRSAFDTGSRGVYILDWESGKVVWNYRTGPNPVHALLRDIDGDNRSEILFGTHAVGNGDSVNGTDDAHTYAIMLDARCRELWAKQIGAYSSWLSLSWLADSGNLYPRVLVAEMGSPAGGRTRDSAFVLDTRNGSIVADVQYGIFNAIQSVLSDADGKRVVLLGGNDDTLRLLDGASMEVRGKLAIVGGISSAVYPSLNSVSRDLVMVPTMDGRTLAVGADLRIHCEIPTGQIQTLYPVSMAAEPWFLANGRAGGRVLWRLYSLAPTPILSRPVSVATLLGALLAAIAVFGSALVGLRYRVTHDMRAVVRSLTGQSGVIEVNNRGQIRHSNSRARELLGGENLPAGALAHAVQASLAEPLGSTPKEVPVALDGSRTVLARAARVRSGVLLTLEDISAVEYLQRVKAWAPVAQKLAHGIKNPLGTIMGAVEQIESEMNRRETSAEARGQKLEARSEAEGTRAEARSERCGGGDDCRS
jgi:hypothetical protein